MTLGILKLPNAVAISDSDKLLLQDAYTRQTEFGNVVLDYPSFSFSNAVTAQDTKIDYLSAAINALSAYSARVLSQASARAKEYIEFSMLNLQFHVYPVNSVKITTDNVNPQTQMINTVWALTATGRFLAGVGSSTDKNVTSLSILTGENFDYGEYTHTLSTIELPGHTHQGWLNGEVDSSIAGYSCESEATRNSLQDLIPYTSNATGEGATHNNIPPFYGVYVWVRLH